MNAKWVGVNNTLLIANLLFLPPYAAGFRTGELTFPFAPGTAANSLVSVFNRIIERKGRQLNYVIPISDNGGSSSELIRVIGGPSELLKMTGAIIRS